MKLLETGSGGRLVQVGEKGTVLLHKSVRAKAKIAPGALIMVTPIADGTVILKVFDDPAATKGFRKALDAVDNQARDIGLDQAGKGARKPRRDSGRQQTK